MEKTQLAVVGGGIAGTNAAIQAARAGVQVTLVDEHPVDLELMAQDIPLHFGQRMLPAVANKASMFNRVVAANPLLQEADDVGVDLQLGVIVWDSSQNNTLTLADDGGTWRLRYERAIFAPGARDLALAFRGWHKAGVVGAAAAMTLMGRYQGFAGRGIMVLGSGDLGLTVAAKALESGVEVAGVVDVAPEPRGRDDLRRALENQGVTFYMSHTVGEALGGEEVSGIAISPVNGDMAAVAGGVRELACDTICMAFGLVTNVELLYWTGCDLEFRPGRGELVPRVDERMRTSHESIYVAGDGAGFSEEAFADPDVAGIQARIAAVSAVHSLGVLTDGEAGSRLAGLGTPTFVGGTNEAYREAWVRSMGSGDRDLQVCLCEEVTGADIARMVDRGLVSPDHLKRLTRAGMGYCQGRRCREQIQMLVARATGKDLAQVPPASYRPPFRPLSLEVIQNRDLTDEEEEFVKIRWYRRHPPAVHGKAKKATMDNPSPHDSAHDSGGSQACGGANAVYGRYL